MKYFLRLLLIVVVTGHASCYKSSFLNKSPSSELLEPEELKQLRGLLSNEETMGQTPVFGEQSSDNYYLPDSFFNSLSGIDQNLYTWQKDIYKGQGNIADWNKPYEQVRVTNLVLEQLAKLSSSHYTPQQLNENKAMALFMRSYAFYNLLQIFSPAHNYKDASDQPGIVLLLSTEFSEKYFRSGSKACYQQILKDLRESVNWLPAQPLGNRGLPCKPAGLALLARIYLSIGDYTNALHFADSCIKSYPTLMDYNDINLSLKFPIPKNNIETLYQSSMINNNQVFQSSIIKDCIVDSVLYRSYHHNDLRREIYFALNESGKPYFRSSYSGKSFAFSGLATDEMYLIRAECNARFKNARQAIDDLNELLIRRFKKGTFIRYTNSNIGNVLEVVLRERRKELVFRGLRWSDIKRLNREGAGIRMYRNIKNIRYQLQPNNKNYALPIPGDVLKGTDIVQNPRE